MPPALPALVTPRALEAMELQQLRLQNADLLSRQQVAKEAYLKLQGELTLERLRNAADRRRMDLLVALCQRARSSHEGVRIHTGEQLHINPPDLRAVLDLLLEAGVAEPLPTA